MQPVIMLLVNKLIYTVSSQSTRGHRTPYRGHYLRALSALKNRFSSLKPKFCSS